MHHMHSGLILGPLRHYIVQYAQVQYSHDAGESRGEELALPISNASRNGVIH